VLFAYYDATATYERIRATWQDQIKERQERILGIIREKVTRQIGLHQREMTFSIAPIPNPFNNSLDDLDDFDKPSPFSSQSFYADNTNAQDQPFAKEQRCDKERTESGSESEVR
jgi:hypothetical protein